MTRSSGAARLRILFRINTTAVTTCHSILHKSTLHRVRSVINTWTRQLKSRWIPTTHTPCITAIASISMVVQSSRRAIVLVRVRRRPRPRIIWFRSSRARSRSRRTILWRLLWVGQTLVEASPPSGLTRRSMVKSPWSRMERSKSYTTSVSK